MISYTYSRELSTVERGLKFMLKKHSSNFMFNSVLVFCALSFLIPLKPIGFGSVKSLLCGIPLYMGIFHYMFIYKEYKTGCKRPAPVPKSYSSLVLLLILVVLVSSITKILDFENFLDPDFKGIGHVNRKIYIDIMNGVLVCYALIKSLSSIDYLKTLSKLMAFIAFIICFSGLLQYNGYLLIDDLQKFFYYNERRLTTYTGISPIFTGDCLLLVSIFDIYIYYLTKNWLKYVYLVLYLFIVACMILTYSRCIYLGYSVFLVTFALLNVSSRKKQFWAINICLFFILIVSVPYVLNKIDFINIVQSSKRFSGEYYLGSSLANRMTRWSLSIHGFYENPFFGNGLGSGKEVLGQYAIGSYSILYSSVHSLYVKWLIETGIFGMLFYAYLIWVLLKNLINIRKSKKLNEASEHIVLFANLLLSGFLGLSVIRAAESFSNFDTFQFLFLGLSFALLSIYKDNKVRCGFKSPSRVRPLC